MQHPLKKAILMVSNQWTDKMKPIPSLFNKRHIKGFVADLITEYGYERFDDISQTDKESLASMLLDAAGRDYEFECLSESSNHDLIIGYLKSSLKGDKDANESLLEILKEAPVLYYTNTMEAIFVEVMENYETARREWLDYAAKEDEDAAYEQFRNNL
jgi:hypothetical protein